ncbi:lipase member H-like [Bradysia coprophila]|uniref:lipase member H-like n=1 Tax=Bradysia coprophila TaxID=38358 RepID=UPI00187D9B62|nr:lipase member H-like [Bradysia coprophila]
MRLIVCALLIAVAGANPFNRTNNVIEPIVKAEDWRLVPDTDYKLHLINVNDVPSEIEPTFVGERDMIFRLFTSSNPITPQTIQIRNDAQLQNSNFNPTHRTRFFIHGWTQGGPDTANIYRDAYLALGNFNIFAVDWGVGAQDPNYIASRNRVGDVGRTTAAYIDWLNTRGLAFSNIVVLGHSLGAHAAGHTGKAVRNGRLPVIVAIDPAGPLFSLANPGDRVDFSDADHVEVLATDTLFLGFEQPIGHATFYPNGGNRQPGCEGEVAGACSHVIAAAFMVESINPLRTFGAIRCQNFDAIRNNNCVSSGPSRNMGGEPVVDDNTRSPPGSVYFLRTNPTSPFSQGPV